MSTTSLPAIVMNWIKETHFPCCQAFVHHDGAVTSFLNQTIRVRCEPTHLVIYVKQSDNTPYYCHGPYDYADPKLFERITAVIQETA